MKNVNESGRSMVEMLGVLAIIGVLSIGGIAGYTRAMRGWRANEIIDAASRVAAMVETKLASEDMTYNEMVGSAGNENDNAVGKIAGGVVSQITAYGIAHTQHANTVIVELNAGNTEVKKTIMEKLGCADTDDSCALSKDITLSVTAS